MFSERHQALYELDPLSFSILDMLAPSPRSEPVARVLEKAKAQGVSPPDVHAALEHLESSGLLISFVARYSLNILIGGRSCLLTLPSRQLHKEAQTVFRSLVLPSLSCAPDKVISVSERGGQYFVSIDARSSRQCALREVIPFIRAAFTDILLAGNFLLALHVATLNRAGRTILLAGAPGAGKTTLATALNKARGYLIHGDDVALLRDGGILEPIAFPLSIKAGSWSLLAHWFPSLLTDDAHLRADSQEVKMLPACTPATRIGPVSHVFFLRRQSKLVTDCVALTGIEAFRRLHSQASAPQSALCGRAFEALCDLSAEAQSWEIFYDALDDAIAAIERITSYSCPVAAPSA